MFSSPYIVSSGRSVYYLTRMIADLLELPCKHIAEVQASRARKEKKRSQALHARPSPPPRSESEEKKDDEANGERREEETEAHEAAGEKKVAWDTDDEASALLARDAHFDLPYTLPSLPAWCIRAFLLTLTTDGYTERCMELACKVLLMMAERGDNNRAIIEQVGLMCSRLSADIERDIRHLIAAEQQRLRQAKGQVQLQSASPPPALSDSQKKRKRGAAAAASPASSPVLSSSAAPSSPSSMSSSLMWRLTIPRGCAAALHQTAQHPEPHRSALHLLHRLRLLFSSLTLVLGPHDLRRRPLVVHHQAAHLCTRAHCPDPWASGVWQGHPR